MVRFRSNPPSRQIAPKPALVPSQPRRHPLCERIDDYLALHDMPAGTFGRAVAGQFSLVRLLRMGARVDAAVVAEVERFLTAAEVRA